MKLKIIRRKPYLNDKYKNICVEFDINSLISRPLINKTIFIKIIKKQSFVLDFSIIIEEYGLMDRKILFIEFIYGVELLILKKIQI